MVASCWVIVVDIVVTVAVGGWEMILSAVRIVLLVVICTRVMG